MTTYNNPTPVAVLMQSVLKPGRGYGLILIRRPDNDGWALPAGYIETGLDQSAEGAALREFREETGLEPSPAARTFMSAITPHGKLLIFCKSQGCLVSFSEALKNWKPTPEALALRIAYEPETLCFPTHTKAMRRWFQERF